jgi:hypothetical protein
MTINTRAAVDEINAMFRAPIKTPQASNATSIFNRSEYVEDEPETFTFIQPPAQPSNQMSFDIYVDEELRTPQHSSKPPLKPAQGRSTQPVNEENKENISTLVPKKVDTSRVFRALPIPSQEEDTTTEPTKQAPNFEIYDDFTNFEDEPAAPTQDNANDNFTIYEDPELAGPKRAKTVQSESIFNEQLRIAYITEVQAQQAIAPTPKTSASVKSSTKSSRSKLSRSNSADLFEISPMKSMDEDDLVDDTISSYSSSSSSLTYSPTTPGELIKGNRRSNSFKSASKNILTPFSASSSFKTPGSTSTSIRSFPSPSGSILSPVVNRSSLSVKRHSTANDMPEYVEQDEAAQVEAFTQQHVNFMLSKINPPLSKYPCYSGVTVTLKISVIL